MNKIFLFMILIAITFSSCRVPYEPDIEADEDILVVDAFLTNNTGASYVNLSKALAYDLDGTCPPVQNATVYLTDEAQNRISFTETSTGYYEPDTAFAGEINVAYLLTVITANGDIYVSDPETIPEDMDHTSVYGGYDQVVNLTEDEFGKTVEVKEDVCAIYFDYMGETVTPRFRYNSSQLVEWRLDTSYIWKTYTDNSLRLTGEEYSSSSINIYKQEICTAPASAQMLTFVVKDEVLTCVEFKRIAEINQYRLNDDSYAYYKKVKAQSDAEGKLFDPIISQIKGNISCVGVSSKPIFGFFEASNLKTMSYIINRHGADSKIALIPIDNLPPHPPAGIVNEYENMPDFWIQ